MTKTLYYCDRCGKEIKHDTDYGQKPFHYLKIDIDSSNLNSFYSNGDLCDRFWQWEENRMRTSKFMDNMLCRSCASEFRDKFVEFMESSKKDN